MPLTRYLIPLWTTLTLAPPLATAAEPPLPTAGHYQITAEATIPYSKHGNICKGAAGTMIIEPPRLSGQVTDALGHTLKITGTITPTGVIHGGFAFSNKNAVQFSGQLQGQQGSGQWEDNYQCQGKWSLSPVTP